MLRKIAYRRFLINISARR